jgi:hypothetical protein
VRNIYWENGSPLQTYDHKLSYFKNDTIECGTPDLTMSITSNNISLGIEKIYPNPFTDKLFVRFADDKHIYDIKIYDIRGVEIFNTKVDHCKNVVIDRINEKGFYIIKLETEGKIYMTKMIKA